MSSCQGELALKQFHVRAVDQEGNVLINENRTTLRSGFIDLWLPRGRTVEVTIVGESRVARQTIGTYRDSKTCVTTFRMK